MPSAAYTSRTALLSKCNFKYKHKYNLEYKHKFRLNVLFRLTSIIQSQIPGKQGNIVFQKFIQIMGKNRPLMQYKHDRSILPHSTVNDYSLSLEIEMPTQQYTFIKVSGDLFGRCFYRTQVSLGSDLWVQLSLTKTPFAN